MCVDLKNVKEYQSSGRLSVLPPIAGTVLVVVLLGWILRELPTAIDQEFGIVPTTEVAPVQVYHPSYLGRKYRRVLPGVLCHAGWVSPNLWIHAYFEQKMNL